MIPKSTVIAFLIFMAVLLTCVLALQQFNYIGTSAQADTNRAGRYVVATTLFDESRSLFWLCNVDNQTLTAFSGYRWFYGDGQRQFEFHLPPDYE